MTFTVTTIEELAETNQVKTQAISLLKEIRIICGVNERKFNFSVDKSNKHPVYFEFNYMSQIIDKFVEENKLEGFKK
jgi:hypothetical protein